MLYVPGGTAALPPVFFLFLPCATCHDCFQPLGAMKCWYSRHYDRAEFDHAGIVLLRRGVPFVLESTHSGPKVGGAALM
jgi:hypothetical protein